MNNNLPAWALPETQNARAVGSVRGRTETEKEEGGSCFPVMRVSEGTRLTGLDLTLLFITEQNRTTNNKNKLSLSVIV